jgi:formate dehydrogenase major subunit
VVLPGASYLEKDGTFTNGERRVQRVRKVLEPQADTKADWQVLCDVMAATGYPQSYQSPSDIMDEVSRLNPAFAGISYARLEGNGLQWPVPDKSHPGTPILHTSTFPRGKGLLSRVEFVPSPSMNGSKEAPLALTTGRVLQHYNAGSMTRRTDNILLAPMDVLEINPSDAAARGIRQDSRVRVWSSHGEAFATAHITDKVSRGTLFMSFHFPETGTNNLTSDVVDRLADCPEYKLTAVDVAPLVAEPH